MLRPIRSTFRAALVALAVAAFGGVADAQPPAPLAMGRPAYPGFGAYCPPGYGYGGYGMLPPRAVYGPSVSPLEFPYGGYARGYPYPGYTMQSPYPRTVSSYSSGPAAYPLIGRVR